MVYNINSTFFSKIKKIKYLIYWFFEDSQKSISNRFDFLDGYRGFCAFTVALHHSSYFYPPGDFLIFQGSGFWIGVFGFFVLSAFLLTYRMTKDLQKSKNFREILEIIIKYGIRRFFRIYAPFVFYVTCLKFGPEMVKGIYGDSYTTWLNFLMLQPSFHNHLWTIPIEIKYYFMIPLICLVYHFTRRYWYIVIILSIGISYTLYQTYLYYPKEDLDLFGSNKLYSKFPVFFSGSIVAFIYLEYENWNSELKNIFKHKIARIIFCCISYWMAYYGIKNFSPYYNPKIDTYNDSLHPGIKFSYLLFIMLISSPNDFTRLFSDNFFFKKIGKFSFGFYLWHPMCIAYIVKQKYPTRIDTFGGIIIMTQLCSIVFYFFIENPLMKLGNLLIQKINLTAFGENQSRNILQLHI